ncbi:MAG: hypothetical protein IJR63_10605 [Synergistaceae bacterium]|nr:hypothetical protein [Synergistaceae bacterium]
MEVAHVYSHLNGLEFMLVRKPELWQEVKDVIHAVDAGLAFDKVSREKTMQGRILYSPAKLNKLFREQFSAWGWHEVRNGDSQPTGRTIRLAS